MNGNGILKSTTVVLILIGALFGLVSCTGVSQEEFDRVSKDLDTGRTHEQQISNDLAVAQSKIEDIETELDDARAKLVEYSKVVETDYPDLRLRVTEASLILEILTGFFDAGTTGDMSNVLQLMGKVDDIENKDIRESVEYMMQSDDISDDEAGMIIISWIEEAERLLK